MKKQLPYSLGKVFKGAGEAHKSTSTVPSKRKLKLPDLIFSLSNCLDMGFRHISVFYRITDLLCKHVSWEQLVQSTCRKSAPYETNARQNKAKNFSKKVFAVSFSESYQSPIPPSNFPHTSKYHLLKSLALAAAARLRRTQRKTPRIGLPDVPQGVISLVKLAHTSCSVALTPQKPWSRFQKRILNWKRTAMKNRNVQKQRVLDQQNWSAEEF